ncbi:MAG: response regulator [Proteobacteria bacterium]|nr:MAG: response regulator [Pseudomonadota bacterium]QKK10853.1 MAG: response regulator [Pseudomonadota bacterium]
MRLLLVEDDRLLGEAVVAGLHQNGFTVDWARDGMTADHALIAEQFDLVALDLGLPRCSGLELLRKLRDRGNTVPVLILTARDTVEDRVQGLDSGADDYLIKPFDLAELNARIRALLRRQGGRGSPVLAHGAIRLDPAAHAVELNGTMVDLSPREFTLLRLLLESAGRVLSRERLEEALYGWNTDVDSNTVEVYIHHLRKKFGANLIRTIRGVGYMVEKGA